MYEIPMSRCRHLSVFQCINTFLIPVNCTKGGVEWRFVVHAITSGRIGQWALGVDGERGGGSCVSLVLKGRHRTAFKIVVVSRHGDQGWSNLVRGAGRWEVGEFPGAFWRTSALVIK